MGRGQRGAGDLLQVCFGLDLDEQHRSGFAYGLAVYQLEYSRNLIFAEGARSVTMRVLASELHKYEGHEVVIAGWLHRRRQHGKMTFAIVRDRTGLAQALTFDPAVMDQLAKIPEETPWKSPVR